MSFDEKFKSECVTALEQFRDAYKGKKPLQWQILNHFIDEKMSSNPQKMIAALKELSEHPLLKDNNALMQTLKHFIERINDLQLVQAVTQEVDTAITKAQEISKPKPVEASSKTPDPAIKGEFGKYKNVAVKGLSPSTTDKSDDDKVREILGDVGYIVLHKNTKDPESFDARNAFKKFMEEHLKRIDSVKEEQLYDDATYLKEFFSPEDLKVKGKEKELEQYQNDAIAMYKAAIKEERNSKAFKNAVFLDSCEFVPGKTLEERHCLHIGGPSGGGKSHAKDEVIKMLMNEQEGTPREGEGNFFVSIDGEKDRDRSQVRNMLLSAMFMKGYKGGEDLQELSKTAVKKDVRDAVIASTQNLNLVTPDTFTDPSKKYGLSLFRVLSSKGFKQIFVNVKANQEQTKVSGNRRAWYDKFLPRVTSVDMDMGKKPQSKTYEAHLFSTGVKSSIAALNVFKLFNFGRTFEINNDVQYYKIDPKSPNGYTLCTGENYSGKVIVTTARVFADWENYNKNIIQNILPQQVEKLKEQLGSDPKAIAILDKYLANIKNAPHLRDQEVLFTMLKAQLPALADKLDKLPKPITDYDKWKNKITITNKDIPDEFKKHAGLRDNQSIEMPNQYFQQWLISDPKMDLKLWMKEMDKKFGTQIKETSSIEKKEEKENKSKLRSQSAPTQSTRPEPISTPPPVVQPTSSSAPLHFMYHQNTDESLREHARTHGMPALPPTPVEEKSQPPLERTRSKSSPR
ncbi:MAG: hypothetical protein JSR17_07095 [Proteobacteria bacterium]|nr:hypothetical protein [Pseudomonadota bacterium]